MKPQKDKKGFIVDESIAALINGGDERQRLAAMPRRERARHEKDKARQDARNGRRAVYDMDPDLKAKIQALADEQKTSASNVAEIALNFFLQAKVDLRQYRVPYEHHPLYECKLVWTDKTANSD
jgi:hypothetical protein